MAITRRDGTVEFVGRVLRSDSHYDRYQEATYYTATVLDADGKLVEVNAGSEFSSRPDEVVIDATREVVKAAILIKAETILDNKVRSAIYAAQKIEKGREVEVVRGRKVKIGTIGPVVWSGETQYGDRVGIKVGSEVVFTSANNVEIADEFDHMPSTIELVAAAHESACLFFAEAVTAAESQPLDLREEMARAIQEDQEAEAAEEAAEEIEILDAAANPVRDEARENWCPRCGGTIEDPANLDFCLACENEPGPVVSVGPVALPGDYQDEGHYEQFCQEVEAGSPEAAEILGLNDPTPVATIEGWPSHEAPNTALLLARAYVALAGPDRAAKVLVRDGGVSESEAARLVAQINQEVQ